MARDKKQLEIAGTEREKTQKPFIKAIEEAADEYLKIRDRRMTLTEQEVAAKANLLAVCQANIDKLSVDGKGNRMYRYEEELVIVTPGEADVKVKHQKAKTEKKTQE